MELPTTGARSYLCGFLLVGYDVAIDAFLFDELSMPGFQLLRVRSIVTDKSRLLKETEREI